MKNKTIDGYIENPFDDVGSATKMVWGWLEVLDGVFFIWKLINRWGIICEIRYLHQSTIVSLTICLEVVYLTLWRKKQFLFLP